MLKLGIMLGAAKTRAYASSSSLNLFKLAPSNGLLQLASGDGYLKLSA